MKRSNARLKLSQEKQAPKQIALQAITKASLKASLNDSLKPSANHLTKAPLNSNKKARIQNSPSLSTSNRSTLMQKAMHAQKNAYAPYSQFHVGAAIELKDGKTFLGCNVENASYGATVCAERVAIQSAVAAGALKKAGDLIRIAVFTSSNPPWPPCGLCRQVIAEFSNSETPCEVIFFSDPKKVNVRSIHELLPDAFLPDNLSKKKNRT